MASPLAGDFNAAPPVRNGGPAATPPCQVATLRHHQRVLAAAAPITG
jgi:hypothetical protein